MCGNRLFFENSVCVSCETPLGYSRAERQIVPLDAETGTYTDAADIVWTVCANLGLSGCTWLTTDESGLCFSCGLTRTRPNDADLEGIVNYAPAERAKRHLIAELDAVGIPILDKRVDERGVAFDLLSSVAEPVTIGHADGIVTIDLAEAEDAHRERIRAMLDEPYRTMLGHFRHEIGHYYESFLVADDATRARYRALFGDETEDYHAAIDRHYAEGAPADWQANYISQYATMHPFEDFAETWAHYLHISDAIQTADEFGILRTVDAASFRELVVDFWIPLSTALNMMNRSMGSDDLYPFVISDPVLDKLDFVAGLAAAPA
ncbi:putative zinc-binding metallopeptidase [Microbacterium sediminicola]|uniref:Zinc-binding metallopeptidase n=1 Tax=Microbacterium sediminicola TaxID=415210 RepID=A0ABP4UJ91_9MICO